MSSEKHQKYLDYLKNLKTIKIKENSLLYLISLLSPIIPFLVSFAINPFVDHFPLYLSFIPPVAVSAYYGGFKFGAISTFVSSVLIYIILKSPLPWDIHLNPIYFVNILLFILTGLLVDLVIDRSRKSNQLKIYKEREEAFAKILVSLNEENIKATQEIKARDEFLSIASHELKTPLTSMLLQIQLILHNIKNTSLANFSVQKLMEKLEDAQDQTQRLSKMINDLLNISLITTGKMDLELQQVDLSETTKKIVDNLSEKIKQDGYQVSLNAPKEVVGHWDKLRIEQVITNLLTNALKYGAGKPVEIKIANSNNSGKIIVKDQGIGISEEHHKKIFERFERTLTTPDIKGLGVGLYITSQIVKAHKGTIKVDSKKDHGSTFTIELPLKQS